jgi:hypothetical protein
MKLSSILVFSLLSLCNSFRLAQYNAEWLFIDQYENCPGSGCTWSNQSEAQKHLSVVATNINQFHNISLRNEPTNINNALALADSMIALRRL